jgi:hypothetical protein
VEGCRSIEMRDWKRRGLLYSGNEFTWGWRTTDGEQVASIGVRIRDPEWYSVPSAVESKYTWSRGGENQKRWNT